MGVLKENNHRTERLPVTERPLFRLLQGHETIEEFNPTKAVVAARAYKFWGVEEEIPLIPRPNNDGTRLDHLNAVYSRISSIDPTTRGWRKKTTPLQAAKILDREVRLPTSVDTDEFEIPVTAAQLFDHPGINYKFLNDLSEKGNPQFIVVRAFEHWRIQYDAVATAVESGQDIGETAHDKEVLDVSFLDKTTMNPVSEVDLERGYRAFEQFMFGVDPTSFLKQLKAVSVEYLSVNSR